MHEACFDGSGGGHECLTGDLATEDSLSFLVRALTSEQVLFDGFEIEQVEEIVDGE